MTQEKLLVVIIIQANNFYCNFSDLLPQPWKFNFFELFDLLFSQQQGTNQAGGTGSLGNILPKVQSAYDDHINDSPKTYVEGQAISYDSFKMGYYDGYMMAQGGSGSGDKQGAVNERWNFRKILKAIFLVGIPALALSLLVLRVVCKLL